MRTSFLLIVLCLLPQPARAQSADELFAAAFKAHGGDFLNTVSALSIRGKSTTGADSSSQRISISASLDGRVRVDYGEPVIRTEVSTSEGTFVVNQGRTMLKSPHVGAYAQLDWLSVFGIRQLAAGIERTPLGAGSMTNRPTERLKAVTGRNQFLYRRQIKDEAEVHFDKETGLVSAISRVQFADESLDLAFTLTTAFSDYRPVAGMALPHQIRRYVNGRLTETITVDSIEINPAFEKEFFGR